MPKNTMNTILFMKTKSMANKMMNIMNNIDRIF